MTIFFFPHKLAEIYIFIFKVTIKVRNSDALHAMTRNQPDPCCKGGCHFRPYTLWNLAPLEETLQMSSLSLSPREWMDKSLDHLSKGQKYIFIFLIISFYTKVTLVVYHLISDFGQCVCTFWEQNPSGLQWCLLGLKAYKRWWIW